MMNRLECGASIRNITPPEQMLPLSRAPMQPDRYFTGVLDPMMVRAIAVSCAGEKALLVSFDLIGAPDPVKNVRRLSERTGIPESQILYLSTHAHATPFLKNDSDNEMLAAYARLVDTALMEAVDEAIASLRPAKLGFGRGKSYININRNQDYVNFQTGEIKCGLGFNAEGPSDKTLDVLRFEDMAGIPIAFFINYPVHCVVMHMNECLDGQMGLSADIGGLTSSYLEKRFPDSVALWSSGAAGDQNPIMMNQHYFPHPETGEFTAKVAGDLAMAVTLATRHLEDILRVNETIQCDTEQAVIKGDIQTVHTPGRQVFIEKNVQPVSSPFQIAVRYEDGGDYAVRMQLLRINDLAFLGFDGELYTSLALNLKAVSPLTHTMIVTHNVSAGIDGPGYIFDDDGIARQALHHNRSKILPGFIGSAMQHTMLEMFRKIQP